MKINIGNKHLSQSGDPDYLKDYIYEEEYSPAKEAYSYNFKKNKNEFKWIIQIGVSAILILLLVGLFSYNLPFSAPVKNAVKYLLNTDTNVQPVFHKILQLASQTGNLDWPMVDDVPGAAQKTMQSGTQKNNPAKSTQAVSKDENAKTEKTSEESMALPVSGKVVGLYGWSAKPGETIQEFNEGIDIEVKPGTKVKASVDGEVIKTGEDKKFGKYLIVKNASGLTMRYSNLSQIIPDQGEKVETGEVIAKVGSAEGKNAKLHFEVIVNGKPIDPLKKLGVNLEESGLNAKSGN